MKYIKLFENKGDVVYFGQCDIIRKKSGWWFLFCTNFKKKKENPELKKDVSLIPD